MIPYIIVFIVLLFFTVKCDIQKKRKNYNTFLIIAIVLLILMAGLRNGVGSDTQNYANYFYGTPTIGDLFQGGVDIEWSSQPLWFLFNAVVRTISNHFLLFQLIHAIVFNLLLIRFLKQTTLYIFTSLLMIYCIAWWNYCFEVEREAICVILFLNGILELRKSNVWKFLLWCLPGYFIHWFFFPIVLIVLLFYYVGPALAVAFFSITAIILFIVDTSFISQTIMAFFIEYGGGESIDTLSSYFQTGISHGFSSINIFGLAMSAIMLSPYIISGIGTYKKTKITLDIILVILYVFFFISQGRLIILSRYLNYLIPFVIVILVNYVYQNKKKDFISMFLLVMMFNFCLEGYSNFKAPLKVLGNSNYNVYHIPYTSIFDDPNPNRGYVEY